MGLLRTVSFPFIPLGCCHPEQGAAAMRGVPVLLTPWQHRQALGVLPASFPAANTGGSGANGNGDYLSPSGGIFIALFWVLQSEGNKRRGFKLTVTH